MKKIFTLLAASLITVSMFAADRRPSVTVSADKKFEVVIDGRSYASAIGNTMDVSGMYNGRHTIKVYALKGGLFSKKKKLISSSSFQLKRDDLAITVDRSGQIDIRESSDSRWDKNDKGRQDQQDHRKTQQPGRDNRNNRF